MFPRTSSSINEGYMMTQAKRQPFVVLYKYFVKSVKIKEQINMFPS